MFTRRVLLGGAAASAAAAVRSPRAFAQAAERDREVFYPSDGLKIQAYVSRPAGRGPFPLVIFNHGSRAGQERRSVPFTYMANLYAAAGYAVLVPERRGYGESEGPTFAEAVGADLGPRFLARMEEEAGDVIAAMHYAGTLPFVDAQRVAVAGWSFGGIVSLLAAARPEAAFRAVIDQAGGSLTWRRSAALQTALTAAAKTIRVPVLFMIAANDAAPEAVSSLAQARAAARLPAELKTYPPFTPTANPENIAPGHLIFGLEGVRIWGKDATAFLAKTL
ncbi:MAG: alpha/beta fold hydrolase [Bauldia sp.]